MTRFLSFISVAFTVCTGVSSADEPLVRKWHFPYVGENAIPCVVDTVSNLVALSGFDTDGMESFYFVGGEPLKLAAYHGEKMVFQKSLDLPGTTNGALKLWDDSLCLFHDQLKSIFSIKKDGTGDINSHPLQIRDGYISTMDGPQFTIVGIPLDFPKKNQWPFYDEAVLLYQYPNIEKQRVQFVRPFECETEGLLITHIKDSLLSRPPREPYTYMNQKLPGDYIGTVDSLWIYACHGIYDDAYISVYDSSGNLLLTHKLQVAPTPYSTLGSDNAEYLTNNILLRKGKLFFIGYDTNDIQITEVNIKKLLSQVPKNACYKGLNLSEIRARIQSRIVSLYKAYMSDSLSWKEQDSLTRQMLTPEAYEKVKRATRATDCDQIVRAQDYSDYGRNTVKCHHLGADWYEVSYQFAPNEEPVFIPLRVESGMGSHPRIDYIVPEWGGRQWGDAMFDVPKVEVERGKDVLTFVSTFYKRYVYSYVTNSATIDTDRKELCKQFCTQTLCDSIEQARVNHGIDDGLDGFDTVINDYDFDALWFAELSFSAIDKHKVLVSFHDYHHLVVTVSGKKGTFLINSIRAQ